MVTGSYTFDGLTNSTTIELSYNIESLFSAEFLRLSVVETQLPENYSFTIAQQSITSVDLALNKRQLDYNAYDIKYEFLPDRRPPVFS